MSTPDKKIKTPAPATPVKPAASPVAKPAAKDSKAVKAVAAPPVAAAVRMDSAPLKPGRRSSARTAIQTPTPAPMVPTHAPDAAKASYSTMTERVIAPPVHAAAPKDPQACRQLENQASEPVDRPGNQGDA